MYLENTFITKFLNIMNHYILIFFHALIKEVVIILVTKQFQFQLTSLVWSKLFNIQDGKNYFSLPTFFKISFFVFNCKSHRFGTM